jgi:hypothetical protein
MGMQQHQLPVPIERGHSFRGDFFIATILSHQRRAIFKNVIIFL